MMERQWMSARILFAVAIALLSTAAAANGGCFEPVPNPFAAGWAKEGLGTVNPGTPLELIDPGKAAGDFVNLWCAEEDATFQSTLTLTPQFLIQSSDPDGENTGIHVSINDGVNVIRAVIFRELTGAYKVALLLVNNVRTSEFTFNADTARFTLKRLVGDPRGPDGTAELTVPGTTFIVLAAPSQLPVSNRPGVKSIEFGTYTPVAASSITKWTALGLPMSRVPVIVDVEPNTVNLKSKGQYVTLYLEFPSESSNHPADIDVSTITLQVIDPFTSFKIGVVPGAPSEVGDGNGNGIVDRMLKFDRATVQSWFTTDTQATFRVEGQLLNGTLFRGDDASVQIINASENHSSENPASVND